MSTTTDILADQPRPLTAQGEMIHPAIVAIMREVGAIGKTEENTQQHYFFRGVDTVYNRVHPLFAKHGVYSVSEVLDAKHTTGKNAKGTTVCHAILTMQFTFYAEDGSHVATQVVGEGIDYGGDKASNKAMSVADKYAILQLLKIPTAMVDSDATPPEAPNQSGSAPTVEPRGDSKRERVVALVTGWCEATGNGRCEEGERKRRFAVWVEELLNERDNEKDRPLQFDIAKSEKWTKKDLALCEAALKLLQTGDDSGTQQEILF